jgi:hypothetical protein
MGEVRPADPVARRRLLGALLLATLLGAAALAALPSLREAMQVWLLAEGADPLQRGALLLRALGLVLAVSLLAPAVYCYLLAARIDAAGEFPPPDMTLVRDAKVLRGDAARGRAWLLRALAIKLALMALISAVLVWVFADLLVR